MRIVYIATAYDQVVKERTPYVYGVFHDWDAANAHFEMFGDKDCVIEITSAQYMDRNDVYDSIAALAHK